MPAKTISKIVTTVCFDEEMFKRLERIRDIRCMTRSRYVQEAINAMMDKDEEEFKNKRKLND